MVALFKRPVEVPAGYAPLVHVTPEQAQMWLAQRFPRQRNMRPAWVTVLAQQMLDGTMELTSITFAVCEESGATYLVDGQHRLEAIVRAGIPVPMVVVTTDVKTEAEVAALYGRLDRGIGRTGGDVLRAHDVANVIGVPEHFATRAGAAIAYVEAGFMPVGSVQRVAERHGDQRVNYLIKWAPEVRAYHGCVGGATKTLAWRRLVSVPVAAVALVTIRHQPEAAAAFWSAVAANDGLRANAPEHTLREYLMDQTVDQRGMHRMARGVAHCWNAAFRGRSISYVKVFDDLAPIEIAGTPLNGKRRLYD